jgi:hypothetical protein
LKNVNYDDYVNLKNYYKSKVSLIASFRMVVFLFIIVSFILGNKNNIFNVLGIILILLFILLIFIHDKYYKHLDYYNKYINILDQYNARKNGEWKNFNDTGSEFNNEMFLDLNIVGDNSLFQYLSVCRTFGGRLRLIDRLSNNKINSNKILRSQEAITELVCKPNFMIDFQINMLCFEKRKVNFSDSFSELNKNIGSKVFDLFIGLFFSCLCLILLGLGFLKVISYSYFYGIFIFNFLINYMYAYIYHSEFESIDKVCSDYSKLLSVCNCVINENFNSSFLNKIKNDIFNSKNIIIKLVKINDLNNLKNNILSSFIFNGLFCINIFVMVLYSKFQVSCGNNMEDGTKSIEELEALISLAGLGVIKKNICMPILEDKVGVEFKNLKYPLLDENKCVGNNFKGKNGINIITGSNMGGKTSFLRTIGMNIILMNAGGYVCADSFSSSYLKIFTSISVKDDIDKGISTFYGELLRVKKAIDYKRDNRLILIDEIFKGTNYQDRIYGAVNVVKKLNDDKTILFITTHDFELCDIKINNLKNYNVREYYEDDFIKFDYKIREGKCESTNAKYLMKKLNIIDK